MNILAKLRTESNAEEIDELLTIIKQYKSEIKSQK